MKLSFINSERDFLAFNDQFYKESPSYQRQRSRSRWALPLLLIPIIFLFTAKFGFAPQSMAIFALAIIGSIWFGPRRFDARVRRHVEQQLRESSYESLFGEHEVHINKDKLTVREPTGQKDYSWKSIDRTTLTSEYLFIFLCGPSGYAIPVEAIGAEHARQAHERVNEMVSTAREAS